MSTTTPGPRNVEVDEVRIASTSGRSLPGWMLILLVFVAGATSLALELSASRLLAPYFGTSLFVWANLIGLILLYLTVGYYVGGRVADRYPRPSVLYGMTTVAALLISAIPVLSRPILAWSQSAFASYSVGVFYGSLVSVILLFAIPVILLGCVSPFAIRLSVERIGKSGRTAGQLYAISTAGSIVGTFLPVLVLIPWIGTYRTFLVFAFSLLIVSILSLILTGTDRSNERNNDASNNGKVNNTGNIKKHGSRRFLSLLLLLPMALTVLGMQGPIKAASGSEGGVLLTERESPYNYIQVVRAGDEMQLVLNEGLAIHSVYNPHQLLTYGPWDYFGIAPYFNNPPFTPQQVHSVCVIGLGAGTIPHELTSIYGPLAIDGVELDREIVNVGRQYFAMNEPNLNVVVQDGRYFLQTTRKQYDIVGIDAYQQPYVPFQLTTTEFFHEVRSHLTPTGVAVINAGHTTNDFRLVDALSRTMRSVFSNVYIIDTQHFTNSIIVATNAPTSLANFQTNTANLTVPELRTIADASINYGHIREEHTAQAYFTDDRAPVEQLIDQIIFDAVQRGKQ